MSKQEVENLKLILFSVEQGDVGILHSLGIKVRQTKHHLQRSLNNDLSQLSIWIFIIYK